MWREDWWCIHSTESSKLASDPPHVNHLLFIGQAQAHGKKVFDLKSDFREQEGHKNLQISLELFMFQGVAALVFCFIISHALYHHHSSNESKINFTILTHFSSFSHLVQRQVSQSEITNIMILLS